MSTADVFFMFWVSLKFTSVADRSYTKYATRGVCLPSCGIIPGHADLSPDSRIRRHPLPRVAGTEERPLGGGGAAQGGGGGRRGGEGPRRIGTDGCRRACPGPGRPPAPRQGGGRRDVPAGDQRRAAAGHPRPRD